MDVNQLVKALGDAAATSKPPQEYCLLWIDHWSMCMTKAEWSGWMQAIGAVVALVVAVGLPYIQKRRTDLDSFSKARQCLLLTYGIVEAIRVNVVTNKHGPADAVASAQKPAANLVLMFRNVQLPPLSLAQLANWANAEANALHLVEFIDGVIAGKVRISDIDAALTVLMDGAKTQLKDFGTKPVRK